MGLVDLIVTSTEWVRGRRIVGRRQAEPRFARAAFYHAALYSVRVKLNYVVPVRSVMDRALFLFG
jgi:hypothetical protein